MLQQLLFSPLCLSCSVPLRGRRSFCLRCARFFLAGTENDSALFAHEGPGKEFVRVLRGRAPYTAAGWALALLERRGKIALWKNMGIDLVVHAPQKPRRKNLSGLALLAKEVAGALGAECLTPAFRKLWDPLESTCRHASLSIL